MLVPIKLACWYLHRYIRYRSSLFWQMFCCSSCLHSGCVSHQR